MIRINKWNETFENADTRKRMRLGWFLCPSGVDSAGYIELMSHGQDGIVAYGVFLAICQWSASCLPVVRGLCARSDGRPMNIRQIAAAIRMDLEVVEKSIQLLSSPDVGWIVQESQGNNDICQSSATNLPVVCQSSASCLPQGEGEGEGEGKGEGEDLMSTCVDVWNEKATQLKDRGLSYATIRGLTKERRKRLKARLSEAGWHQAFLDGVASLPINQWDDWVPDFDFLIANDRNAFKLAEGKYHKQTFTRDDKNRQVIDQFRPTQLLQEVLSEQQRTRLEAVDSHAVRCIPARS